MAKCAYCGSLIVFGGTRMNGMRFCNSKCQRNGYALVVSREIPKEVVESHAGEIHRGLCPKCQGSGPIDVHMSYRVYSLFVFSSWSTRQHICCRSCGVKKQIGDALFSFLFGWWGFPWGFIMTPVQVARNLVGAIKSPDETRPSEKLQNIVRLNIASNFLAERKRQMT